MKFDKLHSIIEKNNAQTNAVNGSTIYQHVLLSWATGCGKTLGALKIIKHHYEGKDVKGYLICKESNHLSNWNDDIEAHGMEFIHDFTQQFLYASVKKYTNPVDFIILDEVHAVTSNRLIHLKKMIGPNTKVIMLSATVNEDKKQLIKDLCGTIGEYHISIMNAIHLGILPSPTVFIHLFPLEEKEQIQYDLITRQIDVLKEKYEEKEEIWRLNRWVNKGSMRKRMLAEFKTNRAKVIIDERLKGKRYIVFTGSKAQAEIISNNYVHSDKKSKENKELIEKFNLGEINDLSAVNMLREGMNLVKIEGGLIIQLDNVKLSFIQMLGKTLPISI